MTALTKTIAAFGLVITAFSTTASADTYRHLDQVALTIDRQAKQLVRETVHYRHASEYRHLVSDAREICRLADHIHELAHHRGSLSHLASDVSNLDSKFHHFEEVLGRIECAAAHGYGHVHGNRSHVRRLMHSIEENIHHLQADLRSLRGPIRTVRPVVVTRPSIYTTPHSSHWGGYNVRPQISSHGQHGGHHGNGSYYHGSRSRGITIGGGSSRITFRF